MSDSRLTLIELSPEQVEFELARPGETRAISVLVGSGVDWQRAVQFPHSCYDSGLTTGDHQLDSTIRRRAGEELARLHAAIGEGRLGHARL